MLQQVRYIERGRMEDKGSQRDCMESPLQRTGNPTNPPSEGGSGRAAEGSQQEEKLLDRIEQMNLQGLRALEAGNHPQALLLFQDCEATLEYLAGRGRTIDRALILAVLTNEAAAYQRTHQFERAASYVEAIIYNLNLFLDSQDNRALLARLSDPSLPRRPLPHSDAQALLAYAARKYDLALYLLQFAGLQSQGLAHEQAFSNARRAVQAARELGRCSWQYEWLRGECDAKTMDLLEELLELPLKVEQADYDTLRHELERVSKTHPASTVTGSQASLDSSLERSNFQEIFTIKPRQVRPGAEGPSAAYKQQPLCGSHASQTAMVAVCGYFTMGAQLQEMGVRQSSVYLAGGTEGNHEGECYHLKALLLAHRHLPTGSRFLQELMTIYRETYNTIPASQISLAHHLDHLTQKYKNYLVDRDCSLSLDDSEEPASDPQAEARWNEEKKESKKLTDLLKQDLVGNVRTQDNYFLEVPSIDSIEMATSLSNRNKTDHSSEQLPRHKKITLHPKLKGSRLNIDYEESRLPPPTQPIPECPREEDRMDSRRLAHNTSNKKSKSKKTNKSRGKLIETKKLEKGTATTAPVIGLMTTITERSTKKLKPRRSPERDLHAMIGSAGVEQARWAPDTRKIVSSEQFKPGKLGQFGSVKNMEPIRMNKVKGASGRMGASGTQWGGLQEVRSLQTVRLEKGSHERSAKGKSRGKGSASFKGKKSHSNSSSKTPLKKPTVKTLPPPNKDKIYTSIKQTVRRR